MRRALFACLTLAIAACDGSATRDNGTMIVPAEVPSPAAPLPAPATNIAITTDRIEKLPPEALAAPPAPAPSAKMQPKKDFTDPPLPAELNDDGGLKPLPRKP